MKHLKVYEKYDPILLDEYSDKLFINIPSSVYFKSDIKFQIILVDKVYKSKSYYISADNVIQFNEWQDGTESFNFVTWDQDYNEDDFERINFMTVEEFYHGYKSSFIRIISEILDRLDNLNLSDQYTKKLNKIVDRLTIHEVEPIIQARKYNL